ncbi:MAG: malto-oligosyltrehalose synthase, partial [Acidimicrobiia bacterium]|nr:malto-oligosyltrehalose synthase [Acidimicrobiia bacterium]
GHRRQRDHTRRELRDALREFVAHFPVYRTYVQAPAEPTAADRSNVACALRDAAACRATIDSELLAFLGELALGRFDTPREVEFTQRLQQVTGPVMAKGVEDTAFYRYHRLVSLNEVGGDPGVFGTSVADFHAQTVAMEAQWPRSMLTLSTHDTKRSADVRARLNVLSEIPQQWQGAVQRWAEHNERHRRDAGPDRNAEYLLYQTLIGAWPIDAERVAAYMAKATKEAKVHTSWTEPAVDYDEALAVFISAILADDEFVSDLQQFMTSQKIVERGRRNSLAQTTLLLTCPGVPDIYQGNELWDLSLVDPDNRRPVDYDQRRQVLASAADVATADAMGFEDVGGPKLWLTQRLLGYRRDHYGPLSQSVYEPLSVDGPQASRIVAFSRGPLVVVAPCHTGDLDGTAVDLPGGNWCDVLTGATLDGKRQPVDRILSKFPVAVLARR